MCRVMILTPLAQWLFCSSTKLSEQKVSRKHEFTLPTRTMILSDRDTDYGPIQVTARVPPAVSVRL